ncbi:Oxaloacetate decarboxylase, gamma chain [Brevinema andersonii]|uniref:Oxaloacetate decarboxylase, gamma chain n=1 Tax=Brevinema andersonii TaxID=34097 RepID=A0A1I1EUI4_BREAD|nr:OadG family protein [Brevinema andersonii]SFB89188.1 Oxaloacetate decarboxylase, gamma chain [Brevinema andersonii]
MFSAEISLLEAGQITLIGMGMVLFVLLLLTGIIDLFKYIPNGKNIMLSPIKSSPRFFQSQEVSLTPELQAIIIASILEDVQISNSKNLVRIKSIKYFN